MPLIPGTGMDAKKLATWAVVIILVVVMGRWAWKKYGGAKAPAAAIAA